MAGTNTDGFDFDAAVSAPFLMRPGLRRLGPPARHLTAALPGRRHQREKLAVLTCFAGEALLQAPGFDAAPALHTLAAQAAREHPGHFHWDGRCARALGVRVEGGQVAQESGGLFGLGDEIGRCLLGLPPEWRLAGLLSLAFREDFAVLDGSQGGEGRLAWLAVALPSHWAPEDKIGQPFAAVHAPVADGAALRAAAVPLVSLACGPVPHERFVWSLTTNPRLHAHPRRDLRVPWPRSSPEATAAAAWWRSERQTFLPVAGTGQAVFTIAVEVRRLAQVLGGPEGPARARRLHDALASMSPAVLDYKGLAGARDGLLAWLQARAAGPA